MTTNSTPSCSIRQQMADTCYLDPITLTFKNKDVVRSIQLTDVTASFSRYQAVVEGIRMDDIHHTSVRMVSDALTVNIAMPHELLLPIANYLMSNMPWSLHVNATSETEEIYKMQRTLTCLPDFSESSCRPKVEDFEELLMVPGGSEFHPLQIFAQLLVYNIWEQSENGFDVYVNDASVPAFSIDPCCPEPALTAAATS